MFPNAHEKIEMLLAEKGMSIKELSEKSGLSRQSIYQLRKVKAHLPVTIHKLAKGFEVPIRYFLN